MAEALLIRTACPDDLPALLALYQHLIPGDAQPAPEAARGVLRQFLTYPGSQIFLGETEGQLVATCTLVVIPNLTRGGIPYALIENVVTHSDHRKLGHGQHLLRHASQAAWAAGCYKIMLLTGSTDPATHAFYQSAGFTTSKTGYQMRRIAARSSGE
jgi:GNAT superfamily N-acetyltransferase